MPSKISHQHNDSNSKERTVDTQDMFNFLIRSKRNNNKKVFVVKRKGELLLALKNNMINDVPSLVSLYHDSNRTGWKIVADQVYARDEHEAALKVQFLNDSHGFMMAACFINALLVLFSPNLIVNAFLAFSCIAGYAYALWTMYQFQSPALQTLTMQHCILTQD
ncbi:hypothetical protein ACW5WN_21015 [Aeromonas lacus]|uniref:hypothetical protein n=1 Tax=Aeromonas lacus TaxID=558884 RepID=UPI001269D588|nr:hypothetical protein [Aeromonas lacus]